MSNKQIELLSSLSDEKAQLASAHINAGKTMEAQENLEASEHHFRLVMALLPVSEVVNELSVRAAMSLINSLIRLNQIEESKEIFSILIVQEPSIKKMKSDDSLLAALYALKAKLSLSKPDFEQALDDLMTAKLYATQVDDEPMLYPYVLGIESDAYYNQGDGQKAAEIDRKLVDYFTDKFGQEHPETIDNLGRLAVSLASLGELKAGIEINQKIIENLQGTEIKNHQQPAAYLNIGMAYRALGEHKTAMQNFNKAQAMWPSLEPRIPFYEASTAVGMARSLLPLKHYEKSEQYFDQALGTIKQEVGEEHPMYARYQIMYAPLLIELGQYETAQSIIIKAHLVIVETYGLNSKRTALANLRRA